MASQSSNAIEEVYRESVKDNIRILTEFPVNFQSALVLTETHSIGEDISTNVKVKTTVEECLNALSKISRLSGDLELLSLSTE
jgi:predicted DNA-binding protein YlxM (UPF0122 family)